VVSRGMFATPETFMDFKNIFKLYYSIVYEHRPSIIVIVSKIIMFRDKSNTDSKTVYTLYVIPIFMKKS
jgi:hypothetical protein